jgi:hypothetical protein
MTDIEKQLIPELRSFVANKKDPVLVTAAMIGDAPIVLPRLLRGEAQTVKDRDGNIVKKTLGRDWIPV